MKVEIKDSHSGRTARVTQFGQLVTAPLAYSKPVQKVLDTPNTAFNFVEPSAGNFIVITDILVYASKSVSNTTPADIQIFQSDEIDSLTVVEGIARPQLIAGSNSELIGLNLIVSPGRWVNATTDDATVQITIMFYTVPEARA